MANQLGYSGNLRVMGANGITHSAIGARYYEDGSVKDAIVFDLNTVSDLKVYNSNALVKLAIDFREAWTLANAGLIPTGLLYVHTEDYPLGEADNVLAEAERLRGKLLNQMRDAANSVDTTGDSDGVEPTPTGARPPSNTEVGQPSQPVPATAPLVEPTSTIEGDTAGDSKLSNKARKQLRKQQ